MKKTLFPFLVLFFATAAISISIAQADDGYEYYGTIASIDYSKKTFVVGGRTFKTYSYTEIETEHGPYLSFCYLQIGHIVEVIGWPRTDYVDATKVEVKNYSGTGCHASSATTVKGNISLININASTIVVKNYTIKITPKTKFKGTSSNISQLYQNQFVNVKGQLQTNGTVKATLINTK